MIYSHRHRGHVHNNRINPTRKSIYTTHVKRAPRASHNLLRRASIYIYARAKPLLCEKLHVYHVLCACRFSFAAWVWLCSANYICIRWADGSRKYDARSGSRTTDGTATLFDLRHRACWFSVATFRKSRARSIQYTYIGHSLGAAIYI